MNSEKLEQLRIAVNQFYLSKYLELPLMEDIEFDTLRKEYESEGRSVKELVEWDSELRLINEPCAELDKIIVEDNDLKGAVKNYLSANNLSKDDYYMNLKYDGGSIKGYYHEGKLQYILGTPDEEYGLVRTKAFWDLFPHELQDKSIKTLQGEVLVDSRVYNQLARNKANGLTNSKHMDDQVRNEAFIRIYRIQFNDTNEFNYERSLNALKNLPQIKMTRFRPTGNSDCNETIREFPEEIVFSSAYSLDPEEVPTTTLVSLKNGDNFQADGVVVYSKLGIQGFKFYYTESGITRVKGVRYNRQANGSYAAVLEIDELILNDKSINNVSSNGVPNMIDMKMGKGALVKVIMANLTIPKVIEVLEPSEDYCFPKCGCGYQMTENDIFGSTLKCGNTGICSGHSEIIDGEEVFISGRLEDWTEEFSWIPKYLTENNIGFSTWMMDNFWDFMTILKVDRWKPENKCTKSGIELEELKIEIGLAICDYNFDRFNELIESSFNFSDLQHSNYVINARTSFEAIQSILNIM